MVVVALAVAVRPAVGAVPPVEEDSVAALVAPEDPVEERPVAVAAVGAVAAVAVVADANSGQLTVKSRPRKNRRNCWLTKLFNSSSAVT